jgi:hypothetical protein
MHLEWIHNGAAGCLPQRFREASVRGVLESVGDCLL